MSERVETVWKFFSSQKRREYDGTINLPHFNAKSDLISLLAHWMDSMFTIRLEKLKFCGSMFISLLNLSYAAMQLIPFNYIHFLLAWSLASFIYCISQRELNFTVYPFHIYTVSSVHSFRFFITILRNKRSYILVYWIFHVLTMLTNKIRLSFNVNIFWV